jgi:hypothetical protein
VLHETRTWCVTPKNTPEEVAESLTRTTWTLCTAFELAGYLFLNDSTSEDGAQEYAVVKRPAAPGGPLVQVESITFGWCDPPKALDYVRRVLAGEFDTSDFAAAVTPRLETPDEHRRRYCPRCA